MDMDMKLFYSIAAAGVLTLGNLTATPVNITVPDGNAGYGGSGVGLEDNETEPGTIHSDAWDLEAFGYDAGTKQLDVIGTFNFKNGVYANNHTYRAGAIFVGTGNTRPAANDWTYAYLLNFTDNTYALYTSFTILQPTDISSSSPWSITPTGSAIANGTFNYVTGSSDPDGFGLGVLNGAYANSHRIIELSLGDLPGTVLNDFYVHTTIECGNDDLQGRYQHVPDTGATMALFGVGLGVLMLARRRFALS